MTDLKRQLAGLSPAKRQLFERRLERQRARADARIPHRPDDAPAPASFAQQRLWIVDRLDATGAAYHNAYRIDFRGALEASHLGRCLAEIVRRHEPLRSRFTAAGDELSAIAEPMSEGPLPVVDLSRLAPSVRRAAGRRLAREQAVRPFDLAGGTLLRTLLLRRAPGDHALIFVVHHIAFDRWSVGVLLSELMRLYEAGAGGPRAALPELPVRYSDYAAWQRRRFAGARLEGQLAWWREQLGGRLPVLELPTDRPRPRVQTYAGATCSLVLPARLTESLGRLARDRGATLFMVLLAAFQALLHRHSGQNDLIVGSPTAGRGRVELEGLIGLFINTLAIRATCRGETPFQELLEGVKATVLAALAHAEMPFEKLVAGLGIERRLDIPPLCQVLFNLHNVPPPTAEIVGHRVTVEEIDTGTSKLDLTVTLRSEPEGLVAFWEYNTDLFDGTTITRLTDHFSNLLAGAVAAPNGRLSHLPMMSAAERQQLVEWNDTASGYPRAATVHELFAQQAARAPGAVALELAGETMTYGELDRRANQLAHHLIRRGVGPEVPVGIAVERSFEMVVGILGILKAGGAYVPLDPGYPKPRLAFMLDDTRAPVVLTQERLVADLPEHQATVVCLDAGWPAIAAESGQPPRVEVTADHLAYVIYTSGSTGRPKGAAIVHRSVVRLVRDTNYVDLGPEEVLLQFAPISFDASTFELWGSLLNGSRLVVFPPHTPSLEELGRTLVSRGVSTLWLTSALFQQMVGFELESLQNVCQLLAGGETLPKAHVERMLAALPAGHRLINGYGPTENTTFTCCHPMTAASPVEHTVPIGRAIAGTRVYLLDERLSPVPAGVVGELWAAGDGVTRCYLDDPKLTAWKLVPDPFSAEPGARLYRVGDQARYLVDGRIEFLGRVDQQVKVRGFRIELGEIETVLGQHPRVREAVAVIREGEKESGDKAIVAYVVTDGEPALAAELGRYLGERLPRYMVPSAVVLLGALPLTPNGKVDRRKLPAPEWQRPEWLEESTAPRTPTEQLLMEVWKQVLRLENVGIHDKFFALGGDSILCILATARCREVGLRITPHQMFQHQTIAELAAVAVPASAVPEVEQGVVTGAVPLTPIQQWFLEQAPPRPDHFNQARMLEVCRPLTVRVIRQAWPRLHRHHDALRMRFVRDSSGWRQVNTDAAAAPPTLIDLRRLPAAVQDRLTAAVAADLQTSLDLAAGPLARMAWLDLGPSRPERLAVVIHHLVVDGVSWRILLEDLERCCLQLAHGQAVELPAKTWSFLRWAQRQLEAGADAAVAADSSTWLQLPWEQVRPLPEDHPAVADPAENTVAVADIVWGELGTEQTRALLHEAPQAYNTEINDVLLAALTLAFAGWTGSPTLLVDLEGHGREELIEGADTTRTVGWFTTMFPVMLRAPSSGDPGAVLKAVKEQLRRIPRRGIGYGMARYLSPDRRLADRLRALPAAQVSFNYLGQFDQVFDAGSPFRLTREPAGPDRDPRQPRAHLLEITSMVQGDRLRMRWTYSRNAHRRASIERLAERFSSELEELVRHCRSPAAGGYTPSDFPRAQLSQRKLDRLTAKLGGRSRTT